jgi:hypothetical protein
VFEENLPVLSGKKPKKIKCEISEAGGEAGVLLLKYEQDYFIWLVYKENHPALRAPLLGKEGNSSE